METKKGDYLHICIIMINKGDEVDVVIDNQEDFK